MKKVILTILASLALTGVSYAGSFGVGVSGSIAKVAADGSEKEGTAADTSDLKANASAVTGIGSVFIDYQFDNELVFGFSHVPGSADVSDKAKTRSEVVDGVSGESTDGAVTFSANAEVENFNTLYLEYPLGSTYVKLGYSQLDVNTKEKAQTDGGTYGNATLDGVTIGAGVNGTLGGFFTKAGVEYTDFEELKLSSTSNNSINANLDILEFKLGIGKRF